MMNTKSRATEVRTFGVCVVETASVNDHAFVGVECLCDVIGWLINKVIECKFICLIPCGQFTSLLK